MIMNKWKKRILIVTVAIALNVLGRYLAWHFKLPAYLNLCGTVLTAYLEGPIVGSVAAVLSCAFCSIFSFKDWYFLIADVSVAIATGLIARKNKFFKRFALIISATAFFAVVKALVLLLINLSLYNGKSGLEFADAIVDYFASASIPMWIGYVTTAIIVSFTDSFMAVFPVFFGMYLSRNFGKKKKSSELKKELRKKAAFGILFALVISSLGYPSRAYAENSIGFVVKLYNSDNGLVGGCLNDAVMTRDGSMWLGTYGGLFRFNGSKFVLIDNLKSVRSVQSLFVDEEDRLWAGTQDAGVTLLNIDMSYRVIDVSTGLPSNSVKCISRDSNGLYYFGTTSGIAVAEYDDGEVKVIKTDADAGNVKDLSPDGKGNMIVMNNLGQVSCYRDGELTAKLAPSKVTPKGINHDPNGLLYVGTESAKIMIYEVKDGRFYEKGSIDLEGMKTIRDFYFDESGIIYVAADNGIGYLDESRQLTMIESGVFNNSIDHVFKDYQGNVWFTSSRCGLLCLGTSSFTDVFKLCNEKNIVCNAIKQWNGYLYVGTNDGLKILDVLHGKSIKNDVTETFDGVRLRSLDIDENDNLLVATYDMGLMEVTKDGVVSQYVSPEETRSMIRMVSTLSDGTVISSSDAGLVFMKDHQVKGKLMLGSDLGGGTILNILETDDHELLCGTDGDGIAILKDGKLVRYVSKEDGLSSGVVLRVVKDERGKGYFVMTGSGLCYLSRDYKVRELGMPYYNNFDATMNDKGEFFVLGGAGIYVCDYESLISEGKMDTYTLLDTKAGLPGSITSNAWNYVTEDGQIYICGTSGVYQLDLNNYEMRVEDFKTKITSITIDGVYEDVTQIGTIVIPKATERIELGLEINNYTSADPYVSYYLSGVDEEKTTVLSSKLSGVTYYDIPYGNHEFVISVLNEKGKELSRQTYVFSKEKELSETLGFLLYFYVLLFAFLGFIVTSIVQGALWSQRIKEEGKHELVVTQLEREKAEALERALHMEEDANKSKTEFLANMSHEIRTPINAIIGMDTMIMRESSEENVRNYARDIHAAGNTLLSLINDVLDFSKIESGKLELILGEYDLSVMIRGIVNMIKPRAEEKNLEFEVDVNPETPSGLYGDEVRIEQVILNLLNNAVKYTEKGRISFHLDYEEAEGGSVLLKVSVKDTGIGIKPEDLERLYSPYERVDEQRNKKIEGTGLGLSITKNLLEKMGSRLEVSSVYGEGSEFGFVISQPVRSTEKIGDYQNKTGKRDAALVDKERFHAPDARILIVDDVEMNLNVAKNLLKRIQAKVDAVLTGEEALRLASENQYDVILLDSMMPGMSGEDTMQKIRTQCPMNAEAPIIVLTAHVVKGAREEYLRLGYTNYLSKPLDAMKLEAMVQSYLPDDKILIADEEQVRTDSSEADLISALAKVDGIDPEKGVELAGGEDAYVLLCRNFRDTAKIRMELIREAFEKEDYDNYVIQVHALKSSARLIGAPTLSKQAEELEIAGREGDVWRIQKDNDKILKEYKRYYDGLDAIFREA